MKIPRDEQRARRSIERPGVEGLELRLVLSGDPWSGFIPSALFGPSDPGSFEFDLLVLENSPPDGLDPIDFNGLPGTTGDWPANLPEIPHGFPNAPGSDSVDFGGGGTPNDSSLNPTPIFQSLVTVDPADGSFVNSGQVDSITATFGLPLSETDPDFQSFKLQEVNKDGSLRTIFSRENPPDRLLSDDGKTVRLVLAVPLGEGRYRLTMAGDAFSKSTGDGDSQGGQAEIALTEFRVGSRAPLGVTLTDAVPLGTVGTNVITKDGTLELFENPAAVQLYRIQLAPGHFWRLGVELSAERIGSPLLGRISIFDASGTLIRTGSTGLADAPNDPFLFLGLKPGTYYIGLSGVGNNPGTVGYNPATGSSPVDLPAQQGGTYSLSLVADPADEPTKLVGFSVDRADPADPVPTGLTLTFDGPIQVQNWDGPDDLSSPVEIVDHSGRVWRTIIASVDHSGSTLSLLFRERLPRGEYTIRLPKSGGLIDLTDRSPEAEGQKPGNLGSFAITTVPSSRKPNDFGALLPSQALNGVGGSFQLAPTSTATVRMVIAYEADYVLTLSDPLAHLSIELIGPNGRIDLGDDPRALNGMQLELQAGTYLIRITNPSGRWVDGAWGIRALWAPRDSVPLNGVGQGPALGMRLAAPAAGLPQVGFDPTPSQNVLVLGEATVSPILNSQAEAYSTGISWTSVAGGQGPSSSLSAGLMLTPDAMPIGLPTTEALRVVALNPNQPGGLAVTASIAEGVEIAQFIPIGVGQSVEPRTLESSSRIGSGNSKPVVRTNSETGRGEELEQLRGQEKNPTSPESVNAIDSALAMLAPSLHLPPVLSNFTDEESRELDSMFETVTGTPTDKNDQDARRAELPLIRALGIGLAVGYSARYWARTRSHQGKPTNRSRNAESHVRIHRSEESGLRAEVLRRQPGRGRLAQVIETDGNR